MRFSAFFAGSLAVTLLVFAGGAKAADEGKKDDSGGKSYEIGAGLLGVVGGNFIDKPSDKTLPGGGQTDVYPGFGGTTVGGGLMLDLRFINLLGLEVDALRTHDQGSGDVTFNGVYKVTLKIEQSAWHVPVLAKVVIPGPIVRPMFFLGPEFVMPSNPSGKSEPAIGTTFDASASSYTMITFGAGVEIKLPLPALDLRIPIALRGSYHSLSDKLADRIDLATSGTAITKMTIHSEWKYQAALTLGVAAYF